MTYKFNQFYIPKRMMDSINLYINEGVKPGAFLTEVICNNLKEAVIYADDENMRNLPAYISYFYNNAPRSCSGSLEIMINYIKMIKRTRDEENNG